MSDETPEAVEQPATVGYAPNLAALAEAAGSPDVWAHEMYELIGHTTGKFIDEGSLRDWFQSFSLQIARSTYRSALFQIANTPLPPNPKGDPAMLLLQLRDELAAGLKHQAI